MFLKFVIVLLPWWLKRRLLRRCFGYELDPSSYIGLSWIFPKFLRMDEKSHIGHFNVAIHLDSMAMDTHSFIGRGNWITGHPRNSKIHFTHQPERKSALRLGEHSAITKNHHVDCTHEILIGRYTTVAGYQSQLLTHSIDIVAGRQSSEPIEIGEYCFVGTRCVVLGGSKLPPRSILAAGAVLTKSFDVQLSVYGGVPAKLVGAIPADAKYFSRTEGFVS